MTGKLALDLKTISTLQFQQLNAENIEVQDTAGNVIDNIWRSERPLTPSNPVFVHDIEYAGQSWQEKVESVRSEMAKHNAFCCVIAALDEVACELVSKICWF